MMQPFTILLFCLSFTVFSTCNVFSLDINKSIHEMKEVQNMKMIREYLMKINKPAEKTIKSSDGDLIDCVLFHKQLAFDHPLLNGKISTEIPQRSKRFNSKKSIQLWNTNGEECPDGTVPFRRTTEEDVLRAPSFKRFAMKPTDRKERAVVEIDKGEYFGAKADFNLWDPYVDSKNEYSAAQMWLVNNYHVADLASIEVGWHVYSDLYGDNFTRVFIYWTKDEYRHTGCFNAICPSFVQTNPSFVLGGSLAPISTYDDFTWRITLQIEKDEFTTNWFLTYVNGTDKEDIGYWPNQLIPMLGEHATFVQFGGEVLNTESNGVHTLTQMGSGHFPREGYKRAAFVSNIGLSGPGFQPVAEISVNTFASRPNCYNLDSGDDKLHTELGNHFYYGGPGRGFRCP